MGIVSERPVILRLAQPTAMLLSDAQFFELCQANPELRIERDAEGTLVIMAPAGFASSGRNAEVIAQLASWARQDGTGIVTDSSGAFTLPNSGIRAPDAAWTRREKVAALPPEERERFPRLVPDFVVELRSPSDRLEDLLAKLEEYRANGASLGWLIDPFTRSVWVFRAGETGSERVEQPSHVSADPWLPGFVLDLAPVW